MRVSDSDEGKQEISRKQLEHATIILGDEFPKPFQRLPPLRSLIASLGDMKNSI